ncbi:clostri-philic family protein [Clostridium sp. UBA1056]
MKSKPGANVSNPMQKGERRQRLHKNQNNVGDPQNKPEFKDFNGNSIK